MSTRPIGAEALARVTGDRQTLMHGEGFARIQIRRIAARNWDSNRDAGLQSHHGSAHRAGQR